MIFATVNAGTNIFTNITLKSILKYHPSAKVFVVDVVPQGKEHNQFRLIDENDSNNVEVIRGRDSDQIKFPTVNLNKAQFILKETMDFLMEQKYDVENVPILPNGDMQHTLNIQYAIDTIAQDFVLIDSDAPLIRPVDFYDSNVHTVGDIGMVFVSTRMRRRGRMPLGHSSYRFIPFIQYINVKKLNDDGILYYDDGIINDHIFSSILVFRKYLKGIYYSTGSMLFNQILFGEYEFSRINYQKYIDHFGSASWNIGDREPKSFYMKYRDLFQDKGLFDSMAGIKKEI